MEEKVAQIDIIRGVEFSTKPYKLYHCAIEPDSDVNYEKLEATVGKKGIGFIHDAYTEPKVFNKFQKYFK